MARRKKSSSPVIELADKRVTGLESIDPQLDLGDGLTLAAYKAAVEATRTAMNVYNTALSTVDDMDNKFRDSEDKLRVLNERMLAAVGVRFGYDSSQYEQAGGTRKSDRRRRKGSNGETSTKAAG